MKQIFKFFECPQMLLLLVSLLSASCSTNFPNKELVSSDGFYAAPRQVYFHQKESSDTLLYHSMGTLPLEQKELNLMVPVRISGLASNTPLRFKVEIDKEKSTAIEGVHFKPLSTDLTIAPGSITGTIPITLLREGMKPEEEKRYSLVLQLVATDDLKVDFAQLETRKIQFDNYVSEPISWGWYVYYFGPFTVVKYLKFLEFAGGTPESWEASFLAGTIWLHYAEVYRYFKAHPEYNQECPKPKNVPFFEE